MIRTNRRNKKGTGLVQQDREASDVQRRRTAGDSSPSDEDPLAMVEVEISGIGLDGLPRIKWLRLLGFFLLPTLTIVLGSVAGFLKWQDSSRRAAVEASAGSVEAAKDATVAMLSYRADTAEKELNAARDRLTGSFQGEYTKLVNEVVIPGAREKKISALAQVPAAGVVSATATESVVLLFVDQTVTVGKDAPTNTASTVRVTMEKIRDRWLVSAFDPI